MNKDTAVLEDGAECGAGIGLNDSESRPSRFDVGFFVSGISREHCIQSDRLKLVALTLLLSAVSVV